MNTRGIIMLAGGAIAGYLIYDKFIKKNGGETTESFTGRKRTISRLKAGELSYRDCCCNDGSTHRVTKNASCPCGVNTNQAGYEVSCGTYQTGASF